MKNKAKRKFSILATFIIVLTVVLTVVSCSKKNSVNDFANGGSSYPGNNYSGGAEGEKVESTVLDEDRKIIKTVNESIQTDSYDEFMDCLNDAILLSGGFISSASYSGENYYSSSNLRYATLTVRIPAENLASFTDEVDSLAIVTSYREFVEDVTSAYIDVESRIAVLEAEETALLEILSKAETVSDALTVRTRLTEVQSDLASLRSQKESYDSRVEYSTVNISINEVRRAAAENQGFFEEVAGKFSDSIYHIGQGIRSVAVWLLGDFLYILMFALVAVGGVFLVRKIVKVSKAKKTAKKDKEND